MEGGAVETWIRTLRERTHRLTTTATALELQVRNLGDRVASLEAVVKKMATADEIAHGVADELKRREEAHQKKVDSGIKRLMWAFGLIVTVLQIATIVVFK